MAEETEQQNAFDPESFKKSIMDEVNKTFQGIAKDLRKEIGKATKAAAVQPATETETPTEQVAEEVKPTGNTTSTEMTTLLRKMKTLEANVGSLTKERDQERTARLESDRKNAIQDALSGIQFRDEAAQKLFRKAIDSDIVRDEEGNLVAKSDDGYLPIAEHVKSQIELQPFLLAKEGRGGSGASSAKFPGQKVIDISDIKPGMDRASLEAIQQAALASWNAPQN